MGNSKKQVAYELIKNRILDSTYGPNSVIDEKKLMEELETSRTPIREAIITLSQEGYMQIVPQRGIFVTSFTYKDIISVFQVRALLEPWLVETYGSYLTKEELEKEREYVREENLERDFLEPGISINHHPHTLLISKCENKIFLDMLMHAEEQCRRIPGDGKSHHPSSKFSETMRQGIIGAHLHLIDLLEAEAIEEAVEEMKIHVATAKKLFLEYWYD